MSRTALKSSRDSLHKPPSDEPASAAPSGINMPASLWASCQALAAQHAKTVLTITTTMQLPLADSAQENRNQRSTMSVTGSNQPQPISTKQPAAKRQPSTSSLADDEIRRIASNLTSRQWAILRIIGARRHNPPTYDDIASDDRVACAPKTVSIDCRPMENEWHLIMREGSRKRHGFILTNHGNRVLPKFDRQSKPT